MEIINNISDIALIFEGGGMRASYTAGILNNLLENKIYFDYVAGISAGSSHSINYLSRDSKRARQSFVDLVLEPEFGGWKYFFKGEGFFHSKYIYEGTSHPEGPLPFDFEKFKANPAQLRIGVFDRERGEVVYFTKDDIHEMNDLMKIIRSSSSLPIFMPPTQYKDHTYLDGGLGGGIALDVAKKDGYKKYFVVLTREKGYRKPPFKFKRAIKVYYRKYPQVVKAMLTRHYFYNQTLDELEQLQRKGQAFLVYPDQMPVSNRETDFKKLSECYKLGYVQGKRDIPKWKSFLEID
ncbi:patatin-like phospholipase family protein [Acetobacterium woodii]|uniref:PNPLA domain-containing protein n=1 Tax=Acetobacterium woodii (strain ATCC 29683 / DSM 1030 / JCM 2381 / KCTC 1655 / WB1) TaxID=931626 RepID=H6LH71_ACEWD|nr:patatin family protein [Acetobacterium woodii]AFA48409.1 hypothetical protein Awo_c16270 [Acetobacterium woodii DSM 1030]